MSSYIIVTEDCHFDLLSPCSLSVSVLMARRLFVESLRGLARIMNSLADGLEEKEEIDVSVKKEKTFPLDIDILLRHRSASVDSGISDCDWELSLHHG